MATGIPEESKPGYYDTEGATKSKEVYDKVAGNIAAPVMPTGATQTYTKGVVGADEILTTATMGAPTTIGARTVSKPTLGAVSNAATTGISAPSAITAAGYTGYTAGAAPTATGATATGLTRTVAGQTGTASTSAIRFLYCVDIKAALGVVPVAAVAVDPAESVPVTSPVRAPVIADESVAPVIVDAVPV